MDDELKRLLERVLAPLVEADGGELYFVPSKGREVRLHLGGRFSGCPGNALVSEYILSPAVHSVLPGAPVHVSAGALLPAGAERVVAQTDGAPRPTAKDQPAP